MSGMQRVREPGSEDTGLSTADVWKLVDVCARRMVAFTTVDGLVARSVLDYPGGFRFAAPPGVVATQVDQFLNADPAYVVWSHAGADGRAYTVAYYSGSYRLWVYPRLVAAAPAAVRQHQWLVRALTTLPVPGMDRGVDV